MASHNDWLSLFPHDFQVTTIYLTCRFKRIHSNGKEDPYINTLLKAGFDTLDFGSFVSPKAMREKLLKGEWPGVAPPGYKYDRSDDTKGQKITFNDDAPLIKKVPVEELFLTDPFSL